MEILVTPKINFEDIKDYWVAPNGGSYESVNDNPDFIFQAKGYLKITSLVNYEFRTGWKPSKKTLQFDKNWFLIPGEGHTFTIRYYMDGTLFYTQTDGNEKGLMTLPDGDIFKISIQLDGGFSPTAKIGYQSMNFVSSNKVQLNIVNDSTLKINYSTVSIGNIGDVKRGYINNLMVSQDKTFIDNFNFVNEQSEFVFKNLFDGNEVSVIEGGNLFTGKIVLKEVIFSKENDEPYLNFIINTTESFFFNSLSAKPMDIPLEYISNTTADKRVDVAKTADQHEADEDVFFYGYVDTNKGHNGNINLNQTAHNGYFRYDEILITEPSGVPVVNVFPAENKDMCWAQGNNTYLQDLTPIYRVKELFKQLHTKYGLTATGDFLDDPMFYNLGINPIFDYEYQEVNGGDSTVNTKRNMFYEGIDVAVFHRKQDNAQLAYVANHKIGTAPGYDVTPYLVNNLITPKYEGIESEHVTANSNFIYTSPTGYYADNTFIFGRRIIPCQTTDMVGYDKYYIEDVLGDFAGYRLKEVNFKVKIDFSRLISDSGREYQFRVTLSDHLVNLPSGTLSNKDMGGNPYSFAIVQDYELEMGKSLTDISMQEIEFTINNLLIPKITSEEQFRYVIKANLVSNVAAEYLGEFLIDIDIDVNPSQDTSEMGTRVNVPNRVITSDMMHFDFSEQDFMKEIITRFNLVPHYDYKTKEIRYERFDNHFSESVVLDDYLVENLSKKLITTTSKVKDNYIFVNNIITNVEDIKNDNKIVNIKNRDGAEYTLTQILDTFATSDNLTRYDAKGDIPVGELIDPIFKDSALHNEYSKLPYDGMTIDTSMIHSSMDFSDFYAQIPFRKISPYLKDVDIHNGYNTLTEACNLYADKVTTCYLGYHTNIEVTPRTYGYSGATQLMYGMADFGDGGINTDNILLNEPSDTVDTLPIIILNNQCILNSSLYRDTFIPENTLCSQPYTSTEWYVGNKVITNMYNASYDNQLHSINKDYRELEMYLVMNKYPDELLDKVIIINSESYIIDKISNFKLNKPTKFNFARININGKGQKSLIFKSCDVGYELGDDAPYHYISGTLFSISPNVTFADNNIGVFSASIDLAMGNNLHKFEEGKEYTIKMDIRGYNSGCEFMGYYKNGSSNGYVIDSTVIGIGTETIEFTYTREAPPAVQKSATLAQTYKLKAGQYRIMSIEVTWV